MVACMPVPAEGQRFRKMANTALLAEHVFRNADRVDVTFLDPGSARHVVGYLKWMKRTVQQIARSKERPWVEWSHAGKTRFALSKDAKELWHLFRNLEDVPKESVLGRQLDPYLDLGLRLAWKWEPRIRHFSVTSGSLDVSFEYPRRVMEHLFRVIRHVCQCDEVRKVVSAGQRNAKGNYLSCVGDMLKVFNVCARPLVLRVDLYFEGDAKSVSLSAPALRAYNKFMRCISEDKIVNDVLWYVGKREDGFECGIHFHILVVLDGHEHQRGYELSEMLGQFWVNECVGSPALASYGNCWLRRGEYQHNALGLLHYTDEEMLLGLRQALLYLCKDGPLLLLKEVGKNLRKGQAPRLPFDRPRRGAPRKSDPDLSTARRILLG